MKLKNTILATTLLSLLAANAFAAKELTPEQAAALKPFKRININGRFNAIGDATDAISKAADEKGADSFYVQGINDTNGNGGNWRVTADLYKANAPKADETTKYRMFNGVKELPKAEAYRLEPFDTVSVNGFFSSQPDVNEAIAKRLMFIKPMHRSVRYRTCRMLFLLTLKPVKQHWPQVVRKRRKWLFLALPLLIPLAVAWAVSLKPRVLLANAIPLN